MVYPMSSKKISVIIPLYNKELSIKNTINSVLKQTYTNFELLIINDGSTDSSLQIVTEFTDDRIRVISKKNEGVSIARNLGIKEAKFDYVFLLDGDDVIDNNCLEYFYDAIVKNPNETIFCCNFRVENGCKLIRAKYCESLLPGIIVNPIELIWKNQFMTRTGTLLFDKSKLCGIDYFNPQLSYYEDMDFILRLLKGNKVVYIDNVLFSYKQEFNSLSSTTPSKHKNWLHNTDVLGSGKYVNFIKSKILYSEIVRRIKNGAIAESFSLIKKHNVSLVFVLYVKILNYFNNK